MRGVRSSIFSMMIPLSPPDCLSICALVMEDPDVAVVGGPSLTPPGDSLLQQLFGSALSSLLGAGAVRNRYRACGVPAAPQTRN